MIKDFKKFILRGNAVDLAVAVVIGAAFGTVVTSLVRDLLTPLIAAIAGQPDFSRLSFTLRHSHFLYGDFLNALISFISIAFVVFLFVIQPINKLMSLSNRNKAEAEPTTRQCPECLSNVPRKARRCMFCTSKFQES
ncbi:MAG: large conductance mechanosensitive channel protein MscL [Candidatus Saccharimonadales bacterium]